MTTRRRINRGVILALGAAMALASAGPALARDLSMSKLDSVVAQVVWGTPDPESPQQAWGILAAYRQGSTTAVSYQDVEGTVAPCDNGTPEPEDDYLAMTGTVRTGDGLASASSFARNLRKAMAAGTVTIHTVAFDECARTWDVIAVDEDVPVALDLAGVGRAEHSVDVYRESVSGEFRVRELSRMRGYHAVGTATLDGVAIEFADAFVARFTSHTQWRSRG